MDQIRQMKRKTKQRKPDAFENWLMDRLSFYRETQSYLICSCPIRSKKNSLTMFHFIIAKYRAFKKRKRK